MSVFSEAFARLQSSAADLAAMTARASELAAQLSTVERERDDARTQRDDIRESFAIATRTLAEYVVVHQELMEKAARLTLENQSLRAAAIGLGARLLAYEIQWREEGTGL